MELLPVCYKEPNNCSPYFYYEHVDYNEDKTNSTFFNSFLDCLGVRIFIK